MIAHLNHRIFVGACCVLATVWWLLMSSTALAQDLVLPDAQPVLAEPTGKVILEIHGNIGLANAGEVARYDWGMLQALPRVQIRTHTSVTDGVHAFEGFLVRDLLTQVQAAGDTVLVTALNYYEIQIPIQEFHDYDVILADTMDGERLRARDKGPLWVVYPRDDYPELQDIRYDYRWVWQVFRLDVL